MPKVRLDPVASDKRFLLGSDYFGKGAIRPALEELFKAVELNPRNADAHNLIGLAFLRQAAEFEEQFSTARCLPDNEAQLERNEMQAKLRMAAERFRRAAELRANFSEAWNNLAVVELRLGRFDAAINASTQALSNITYRQAWAAQANLGWAYYQKGETLRATKELRGAIFTNPRFCVGRYRLAKIYYDQRNYEEARMELEYVVNDSACPIQEAYHLMGLVLIRLGGQSQQRAPEAFRRCVELAPRSCLAKECRIAN